MPIARLIALSRRIGFDIDLIQGPGGNTSVKADGVLWIKASGAWLAQAERLGVFCGLHLAKALAAMDGSPLADAMVPGSSGRPSIETLMHAVLPHRVVVHVHSVRTIAIAVRPDAARVLAGRLAGLRWGFVPYIRPGLPLGQAVAALATDGVLPDVMVLGNHGLVVAADDEATAERLLLEAERRLDGPAAQLDARPASDRLWALAREHGLDLPASSTVHGMARDPRLAALAVGGTLYPDQAVFLGPRFGTLGVAADADLPVQLVPGEGILVRAPLTAAVEQQLQGHAQVLARLDPTVAPVFLDTAEAAALSDWEAEKFRKAAAN